MKSLTIIVLSTMTIASCAGQTESGGAGGSAAGGGAGEQAADIETASGETVSGGEQASGGGADQGSNDPVVDGKACPPVGMIGEMQTCLSDCECSPGLLCQPCTNTAEHNCKDYCQLGDPKCNWGVVTCPTDPGAACPAIKLCKAPL